MIGNKDIESSDSDDSDFVVNLHRESSDESLLSECESKTIETKKTYENNGKKGKKKTNKKKNQFSAKEKQRCFSNKYQNNQLFKTNNEVMNINKNKLSQNEERARADSLWKNFLNDTATSSKAELCITTTNLSTNTADISSDLKKDCNAKTTYSCSINLNKPVDSKLTIITDIMKNKKILINKNDDKVATTSQIFLQENNPKKRHISSILHNIQKKQKLTTLEKSKLDWKQFKEEHNLEEEISHYNRGKSGYLEKQDFLQRTDSRQFEIEKELRNIGKRKNH